MNKHLIFYFLILFTFFACTSKKGEFYMSNEILISDSIVDRFNFYSQTFNNNLLIQSSNQIYSINNDGHSSKIFDLTKTLNYSSLYQIITSTDSLLNFYPLNKQTDSMFYLENFFCTKNKIYTGIKVLVSHKGFYEGQEARYNQFFPMLIEFDKNHNRLNTIYPFAPGSAENNNFNFKLGFTLLNNSFIFRNFTKIDTTENVPELLSVNYEKAFNSGFKAMEKLPYLYKKNHAARVYTINRGCFFGESRRYYCGSAGCFDLRDTSGQDILKQYFKNPSSVTDSILLFNPNDLKKEAISFIIKEKHNDEKFLFLKKISKEGDIITSLKLGTKKNISALEIINNQLCILIKDPETEETFLRYYQL